MAAQGMWKTTDIAPLLAERGIHLSAAQIYRLVSGTPERLSLPILVSICDILGCTPSDLISPHIEADSKPRKAVGADLSDDVLDLNRIGRPRRARITPDAR
ncbi:helix-turn-helix domain-containing protein [Streptomyces sp. SID5474]|nr:helix-turn-helix domain-containing protein [Streptomyces sp. SID5474]